MKATHGVEITVVTIDLGEITTTAGPVTRSRRVPPRWLAGAVAAMLVFALTGATPGRPGLVVRWNTAVGVAGFALGLDGGVINSCTVRWRRLGLQSSAALTTDLAPATNAAVVVTVAAASRSATGEHCQSEDQRVVTAPGRRMKRNGLRTT